MVNLRRCPNCGGTAMTRYREDSARHCYRVRIECKTCGRRTKEFDQGIAAAGLKSAALEWNALNSK